MIYEYMLNEFPYPTGTQLRMSNPSVTTRNTHFTAQDLQ